MDIDFEDEDLRRLYTDKAYSGGRAQEIVRAYRKRVWTIQQAPDERDFYALRSLHFEKLKGKRQHQHSMRLNKQWRLILEFEGTGSTKRVKVISIEDYH